MNPSALPDRSHPGRLRPALTLLTVQLIRLLTIIWAWASVSPWPATTAGVEVPSVPDPISAPAKDVLKKPLRFQGISDGATAASPSVVSLDFLQGLGLNGAPKQGVDWAKQPVVEAYGRLPLSFEANVGQTDPRVRFLSRGPGYTLFLTAAAEAVLVCGQSQVVRMQLAEASPAPEVRALEERAAKSCYFVGNDRARWRSKVANYGRVRYQAVYPGIDLVYYGNRRQLEYDFVVAPGADPSRIQLSFPEARQLRLDETRGDLKVVGAGGEMRLQTPVAYQVAEGKRVGVEARYALEVGNRVRFALGRYDAAKPLIIDPVLVYSTFLGGSGGMTGEVPSGDSGSGIAVDLAGNVYVTGTALSPDFPGVNPLPAPNNALQGPVDALVSKLSFDPTSATLSLAYSTLLGGTNGDGGAGIAVDSGGNAYVTGRTSSPDFPVVNALLAPNNALTGYQNAFVAKIAGPVPFAASFARLKIEPGPPPGFKLNDFFTLGTASKGVDLSTDDLTLQVGTFSVTIPAGSFTPHRPGRFFFEGLINGVSLAVRVVPLGGNGFIFKAEASGVDLTGLPNPVRVMLTLGDDAGSTAVTAKGEDCHVHGQ